MAKEFMDYISLLPPPPDDLVSFMYKTNRLKHRIIHKDKLVQNPDSGEKSFHEKCWCTHCNETFQAIPKSVGGCGAYSYGGFIYNNEEYRDYSTMRCPVCGHRVEINKAYNYGWQRGDYSTYDTVQVFEKIGDKFAVIFWKVIQSVSIDSGITHTCKVDRAYIFDTERCYTIMQAGWRYYNEKNELEQKNQFYKPTFVPRHIYPWKKDVLKGTTMENSRLDIYLKNGNKEKSIQYLRIYQGNPKIETLMDIGAYPIICRELEPYDYKPAREVLKNLNWNQKSPYKILGVNREEYRALKHFKISYSDFERLKELRRKGVPITAINIALILTESTYTAWSIACNGENVLKTIKYLRNQDEHYPYLTDYWGMAKKLGMDLSNPIIRYPKNLKEKHDEAVEKVQWNESKELQEAFKKIAAALQEQKYSNGEICIRIAESEKELIQEGKILHHCVGGYAKTHCAGRSIFFVRKVNQPETPWYTLQVGMLSGEKIQLHGYKNDAETPIPQEVKDFVDYWLKNVFRRFDVQTMKFIDKPKATAIA
ncbi:MAG: PcfJ domain-containing protein [Oscillospiraceae bacterium]|nr:PcfJ domain-containing protein [Oscillospiraceae bacterium]